MVPTCSKTGGCSRRKETGAGLGVVTTPGALWEPGAGAGSGWEAWESAGAGWRRRLSRQATVRLHAGAEGKVQETELANGDEKGPGARFIQH